MWSDSWGCKELGATDSKPKIGLCIRNMGLITSVPLTLGLSVYWLNGELVKGRPWGPLWPQHYDAIYVLVLCEMDWQFC